MSSSTHGEKYWNIHEPTVPGWYTLAFVSRGKLLYRTAYVGMMGAYYGVVNMYCLELGADYLAWHKVKEIPIDVIKEDVDEGSHN